MNLSIKIVAQFPHGKFPINESEQSTHFDNEQWKRIFTDKLKRKYILCPGGKIYLKISPIIKNK